MMNRFVIADADKCIGCRTCEIACAVSHGDGSSASVKSNDFSPRLKVIKNKKITTPVMCRQCDNAPCASACPTDAIIRDKQSIQIVKSRCIGCKTCMISCPFGAMSMIYEESGCKAMKCDLCIDNPAGPACLSVCPTAAIRLVTGENILATVKEKQIKTALDEQQNPLF